MSLYIKQVCTVLYPKTRFGHRLIFGTDTNLECLMNFSVKQSSYSLFAITEKNYLHHALLSIPEKIELGDR